MINDKIIFPNKINTLKKSILRKNKGKNMTDNERLSYLLIDLFKLAKKPTDSELFRIKQKATRIMKDGKTLDSNVLFDILQESIEDCWYLTQESVDTTSTINIMKRIIAILKGNTK